MSNPMVIKSAHYIGFAWVAALAVASVGHASDALRVVSVNVPASGASLTPNLASSGDALYLSWLDVTDEGHALRVARWDETRFGEPHTIHASDHFFANWADFASVLPLPDGRLAAHWLEKAADGTYEYDVWIAVSEDGGTSWGTPARPHRDGTLSEHGFVSMVPYGDGFGVVWLDGREFASADSENEMTLRFSAFSDAFGEEVLLDSRVCECCQTGMARTDDGLFVAYRDRSAEEIRDIGYVRLVDGAWTEPETLHGEGWELPGCPVNGPQVAADGTQLAVAWFTGEGGDPRVQIAFSEDGGASFDPPMRIDDGNAVGRVDVSWLGDAAVVSWMERRDGRDGDVRVKRVAPDGGAREPLVVATTGSGRASGFPRMAPWEHELFIAWTESHDRKGPSRVRVAKITEDDALTLVDEPAKDFEAESVDGKTYRLTDLRGDVVLLNFWGIWCTSCRQEIPLLVELDRKWRDSGLMVLGADYGDDPEDLPGFIDDIGMTYPVLVDEGLADAYEVLVYPTSVVIDRSGRVRYRVEGFTEESFATLARVVEHLISES